MNIIFESISAKNFMSFKSLDLNLRQFDKQTVLITGKNEDIQSTGYQVMNGSGKTTLLNAILYAVYGETLKTLKSKEIAHWGMSPKEDVCVTLEVTSGSNRYTIQRLLKGKTRAGELHVYRKESDEWVEVTLSTMSETQRMIETEIIPCGKEGFLRCIILTADQEYNFFKLSKSAKNSFFESLFELTTYSEMYDKLHRMTLDCANEITAESKLIDTLNDSINKLKKEQDDAVAAANDVDDAFKALNKLKAEYEWFKSSNDSIDELTDKNDKKHNEFKNSIGTELKRKLHEFDIANNIKSVSKSGDIVVDNSAFSKVLAETIAEFDKLHNLNADLHNVLSIEDSDDYKSKKELLSVTRENYDNTNSAIKILATKITELERLISGYEKESEILKERIASEEKMLGKSKKITNILCEDCKNKFNNEFSINEHLRIIKDCSSKISEYNKKIEELKASELYTELENSNKKLCIYREEIDQINEELNSLKDVFNKVLIERDNKILALENEHKINILKIQNERNSLKNEIISEYNSKVLENKNSLDVELASLSSKYSKYSDAIRDAEYRYNTLLNAKKNSFEAPIKSVEEQIAKAMGEFNENNITISHYKALEEILKPENLRKSVVVDMLKELNFRINGYLSKMGANYSCTFDEDFEATFTSSKGIKASYNNFSGGESMRLSIACCLAFKDFMQVRLDIHSSILMIDEYIDSSLDPMAVNEIMDFIHYMVGSENVSAFIISHRSEVKDNAFDSEILIRKKDDESHLVINGVEQNCKIYNEGD